MCQGNCRNIRYLQSLMRNSQELADVISNSCSVGCVDLCITNNLAELTFNVTSFPAFVCNVQNRAITLEKLIVSNTGSPYLDHMAIRIPSLPSHYSLLKTICLDMFAVLFRSFCRSDASDVFQQDCAQRFLSANSRGAHVISE